MAKLLNRAQILSAPIPTLEVEVPEWGGTVRVRALSPRLRVELTDLIEANQRAVEDYEEDQALDEADRKGVAKVETLDQTVVSVIHMLVDEDGNRLLSMDDYDALVDCSVPTLRKVWEAFLQLEAGTGTLKKSSK
jgi:hypothetical protein